MALKLHSTAPFKVMVAAAGIVAVTVHMLARWGPHWLINATPSEPTGIYQLVPRTARDYRRGMTVVFPVPKTLRELVYGRGWMRPGAPFLKELAGLEGDRVCISGAQVDINERRVGPVFSVDRAGRPLPQKIGCFKVPQGEFFAASGYFDRSFDGRYFGTLPLTLLLGEARPVWTF